jgi:hypothetical protein
MDPTSSRTPSALEAVPSIDAPTGAARLQKLTGVELDEMRRRLEEIAQQPHPGRLARKLPKRCERNAAEKIGQGQRRLNESQPLDEARGRTQREQKAAGAFALRAAERCRNGTLVMCNGCNPSWAVSRFCRVRPGIGDTPKTASPPKNPDATPVASRENGASRTRTLGRGRLFPSPAGPRETKPLILPSASRRAFGLVDRRGRILGIG